MLGIVGKGALFAQNRASPGAPDDLFQMHENMGPGIPICKVIRNVPRRLEEHSWRTLTYLMSRISDTMKGSEQFEP